MAFLSLSALSEMQGSRGVSVRVPDVRCHSEELNVSVVLFFLYIFVPSSLTSHHHLCGTRSSSPMFAAIILNPSIGTSLCTHYVKIIHVLFQPNVLMLLIVSNGNFGTQLYIFFNCLNALSVLHLHMPCICHLMQRRKKCTT